MMRTISRICPRWLAPALVIATAGTICLEGAPSHGQSAEQGWVNLFPGADLKGWKRVGLDPDYKVGARNPWKVDLKNKILHCDGVGVKEMLLYDKQLGDGVFHVEWRFHKVPGKDSGHNSGVYVRSQDDGKVWLQAQVAMLDKSPQVADLFGDVPDGDKLKRILVTGTGHKHVHPVGAWNAFDIHCRGKSVTVVLNGQEATAMNDWILERGFFGLQAEFFVIEFRNLKWKPAAK
jgi:hypothetical protein